MVRNLNIYTAAFLSWKKQTQATFEFSVLVCNAVPTLKQHLKKYEKGDVDYLVKADYYGPEGNATEAEQERTKDQLKISGKAYKANLAQYTLISNFSFFETYITTVLQEMIAYHGGQKAFLEKASLRGSHHITHDTPEVESIRRKIRRTDSIKHAARSSKATADLEGIGYRFPVDLLSSYGAKMLVQKIETLRSVGIPELLTEGLHMPLEQIHIDNFHRARDLRNKVAHGDMTDLTIGAVSEMSKQLRKIVLLVDQHLLRYYFIDQRFLGVKGG